MRIHARAATHGVDVAQCEVIDVELSADVNRRVHHQTRLLAVVRAVQHVGEADQCHVLVLPDTCTNTRSAADQANDSHTTHNVNITVIHDLTSVRNAQCMYKLALTSLPNPLLLRTHIKCKYLKQSAPLYITIFNTKSGVMNTHKHQAVRLPWREMQGASKALDHMVGAALNAPIEGSHVIQHP